MKVRLKVLSGKSAGKEINLNAGEFLIGRGDGCQLRPRTDAISRKHCRFFVGDDEVRVSDLQSRNGTYVNGQKIAEEVSVKPGDKISVGPLQFELVAAEGTNAGGRAAPVKAAPSPVEPSKAKAVRQPVGPRSAGATGDDDIFGWLEEADEPFALPPRRLPRRVRPAGRPSLEAEMVHWSIAALTVLTALSVLFGAFGGTDSEPRELLPIMITTPAR